ncbi:MAG: RNA pseudouridine synthase [Chitinophagaceae bacterium]
MTKSLPDILAVNEHFIAINKPSGLLSIPDREGKEISLKVLLQQQYGSIFTVHRIDRDTSGVIVFARNEATHKLLSEAFQERTVEKYYTGIVNGIIPEKKQTIDVPIMEHPGKQGIMIVHKKGKPSVTDYEVMEEYGKFSVVKFRIHTGRTHQIRVHMKNIGHPIVCDPVYGDGSPILVSSLKSRYNLSKSEDEERPILNRLGLHARQLIFTDIEGKQHNLEAPLFKDMRALVQQLKKWKA